MSLKVFVDTSAWYALVDSSDKNHKDAVRFLETEPLMLTTNFVIDEVIILVLYNLGYTAALELGHQFWENQIAQIIWLTKDDQQRAWKFFKRYQDKLFSFTDCTSFVLMQKLGLSHAFAFDRHFEQVGQFVRVPATVTDSQ